MRTIAIAITTVALCSPSALAERPKKKKEACSDRTLTLSVGGHLGITMPFGPAMEAAGRHQSYGSDTPWTSRGIKAAALWHPLGCLDIGVVARTDSRHEATTRLGESVDTRSWHAAGLVGFRIGDWSKTVSGSAAFGVMRTNTRYRSVNLVRTAPTMVGAVEMSFGITPTLAVIGYYEMAIHFGDPWGDYFGPQLGGIALGIGAAYRID